MFPPCRTLVLATGMGKANVPTFQGNEFTESYSDISTDPEDYEGQTVLILGKLTFFTNEKCGTKNGTTGTTSYMLFCADNGEIMYS